MKKIKEILFKLKHIDRKTTFKLVEIVTIIIIIIMLMRPSNTTTNQSSINSAIKSTNTNSTNFCNNNNFIKKNEWNIDHHKMKINSNNYERQEEMQNSKYSI